MKISSGNEWDKLEAVIVGRADYANWPDKDPVYNETMSKAPWTKTPYPKGPVPQHIIDETNEDLEVLVQVLEQAGVEVLRPDVYNFQETGGMYNYCPRDRILIAGEKIIDVAMMLKCREKEFLTYHLGEPLEHRYIIQPRQEMVLDAANVCRLNDTYLYMLSPSGNEKAAIWLADELRPDGIHLEICEFDGIHIDSTITPLRDGFVVLNGSRVNGSNCPKVFDKWDKLYVNDVVPQDFYEYPYASKWIALNMFSIDPETVIVDAAQTQLIKELESKKFTVIPLTLRHSRTLGGGFHCVTLDLRRSK